MAQSTMNDLVDGMKRMGKMSFVDLPDIAIMQVMDKLDIVGRHKMRRVSKRMHGLQLKISNNLETIELKLRPDSSGVLTAMEQRFEPVTIRSSDQNALDNALTRLAVNTHVKKIELTVGCDDFNSRFCAINKLFTIEADELYIPPSYWYCSLPEINISTLLSLVQKYRKISIEAFLDSITVQDLCLIRKMMIEGNCNLKSFHVKVHRPVHMTFILECFEIGYEQKYGVNYNSIKFRASDESVEIYMDESYSTLCHIEGNLKTIINNYRQTISFKKCNNGAKPDDNYEKVKWNHKYVKP